LSADIASVSFALGPEIVRIRMGLCQVRGQAWDRSCAAASTLPAARAAVADIVSSGRGDGPRWNAADLLATLGVDLPAIQRQMRAEYGLCVPKTSSTLCDQAVFVDEASGVGLPSDAVPVEIDRFG
jgi:hypothetical protein